MRDVAHPLAARPRDRVVAGAAPRRARGADLLARRASAAARAAPRRHRAPRSRHLRRGLSRRRARRRGPAAPAHRGQARAALRRRPDHRVRRAAAVADRSRQAAFRITAHKGTLSGDRKHASFTGNVRAVRDAGPTKPGEAPGADRSTVTTEYLHVVPDKEIAPHRQGGDDRGAAWNNPLRRARARQQGQDAQARLRRQRHPATASPAGASHSEVEVNDRSCLRSHRRARARSRPPRTPRTPTSDKPITFTSDGGEVNYEKKTGVLTGNVVITQGTLTIRADRIDFKQNADNSLSATAFGNPLSFRQKRDDADGYYEGWAQRAEYDGAKEQLELFDNAHPEARRRRDPQQLHLLQRRDRAVQGRRARRRRPRCRRSGPRRPRARHVPAEDERRHARQGARRDKSRPSCREGRSRR